MSKSELWLKIKGYMFEHLVPEDLWSKISEFFGGEDASLQAFATKVARKLGWTKAFALRAIHEYKKFVFLGVTAKFSVTPSKVIDQVWHEHILFNKGYRDFCEEILGQNFDHNPELIPMDDQTGIFNAQYLDTLALYKTEFNVDPPEDIWGKPKFDPEKVADEKFESKADDSSYSNSDDDLPLYLLILNSTDSANYNAGIFPEFHGHDGEFGGGGATGNWENSDSESSIDNGDDSGGGDSGGGDSGSSCSSGSSCGASCGGGGD